MYHDVLVNNICCMYAYAYAYAYTGVFFEGQVDMKSAPSTRFLTHMLNTGVCQKTNHLGTHHSKTFLLSSKHGDLLPVKTTHTLVQNAR